MKGKALALALALDDALAPLLELLVLVAAPLLTDALALDPRFELEVRSRSRVRS